MSASDVTRSNHFQINLDSNTRVATLQNLEQPSRDTFEVAQRRIQNLMEKDSYPRFLSSQYYSALLTDRRDDKKSKSSKSWNFFSISGIVTMNLFVLYENVQCIDDMILL